MDAPHLLLHQLFELCDLLGVLRMAADVVFLEESLRHRRSSFRVGVGVGFWVRVRVGVGVGVGVSCARRECSVVKRHLLVSGNASVDGSIDDTIQCHTEQVDVGVQLLVLLVVLLVLVLADQRSQLLVLVLHHRYGVLQRTHLHLSTREHQSNHRLLVYMCVSHQFSLLHLKPG